MIKKEYVLYKTDLAILSLMQDNALISTADITQE